MSRVFWDTNLFIYLLEDHQEISEAVASLRDRMLDRGDELLTSTLTIGEILVKPLERGDTEICRLYETEISAICQLIPFDLAAAKLYARLRVDRSLRAPDAIQLACAGSAGADLFITNDPRLSKKRVEGIQFIVPLDRVPI